MLPNREITTAAHTLAADTNVSAYRFISRNEAYSYVKRLFSSTPTIAQETKPVDLPAVFEVRLSTHEPVGDALGRYKHLPGVDVVFTENSLSQLQTNPPRTSRTM